MLEQLEALGRPGGRDSVAIEESRRIDLEGGGVPGGERGEYIDRGIGGEHIGDPGKHAIVAAGDASEQRGPWEEDGDPGGSRRKLERRPLDRRDREGGIRQAAATSEDGSAGRTDQGGPVGVDAEHEHAWLGRCAVEHGTTVAGADVDDQPAVADQLFELADVHLEETPTRHELHRRSLCLHSAGAGEGRRG
jgi:hypothetical protein